MRNGLQRLLSNNSLIFLLAMLLAMVYGDGASWTEPALIPVLALIMGISILDVSSKALMNPKEAAYPIIAALSVNYIALSGLYIVLSSLFIDDTDIQNGFILVAAVPPAIAVIPLTYLLGGNTRFSLLGNIGLYILAFAITPLVCIIFLGSNLVEPGKLLLTLVVLIIVPIVMSRIIRLTSFATNVEKWRATVVNWGFFVVIYTIVGLNRDEFLEEPGNIVSAGAIAFVATFVIAEIVNRVSTLFGVDKITRISLMLMSSRKNDGMAGGIALVFFGARAAMPVAVVSAFGVIHFIWLTWWVKRMQ